MNYGVADVPTWTFSLKYPKCTTKRQNERIKIENTWARRGQLAKLHSMVNDLVFAWLKYHSCLTHNHFSSKWKSSTIDSPHDSGSIYTTMRTRRTESNTSMLVTRWIPRRFNEEVRTIFSRCRSDRMTCGNRYAHQFGIAMQMCVNYVDDVWSAEREKKWLKSRGLFTFGHESRPKHL